MPTHEKTSSLPSLKGALPIVLGTLCFLGQLQAAAAQTATDHPPVADAVQDFDAIVKGSTKFAGLFTFYRQRKGTTDSIYMEVPEKLLGKNLFLEATASSGTMATPIHIFQGKPLNDLIFQIHKIDDTRVEFAIPAIDNRAMRSVQARRALEREYNDETLVSFEIKGRRQEQGTILLDVTSWLKNDPAHIASMLKDAGNGYVFDATSGRFDSIKALPENAVVRMVHSLTWSGAAAADQQRIPFAVSYNLSVLPEDGYRPRIGDVRVGFMATSFLDHSDPTNVDPRVSFIRRWHLEKADPSLPLSPPKKPIVFYIDNAMPLEYREPTRQGLLMWNTAFEKAGFKDAIEVKQMPEDADWDIADTRYNVVRWMVNLPFSTALVRSNDLTGEIVGASINFDSSFAQFASLEYDMFDDGRSQNPSLSTSLVCPYPARTALLAATAIEALADDSPKEKKRLVDEFIRESVAHEMGHCLGLRHNFMGSTYLTEKDLGDPQVVNREGTTASVMDYIPENIEAIGRPEIPYYSGVVGRYDKWAIEYGYKPLPAQSSENELPTLRALASRTNEPGLAFLSDEIADDWAPAARRFDMSRDPLAWSDHMNRLAASLRAKLSQAHPKAGESYYEFTRRFNILWFIGIIRPLSFAETYIGGLTISNSYRGDPSEKPPVLPVSLRDQHRALNLICRMELEENSPGISSQEASMMAGTPNGFANQTHGEDRLAPVLDRVTDTQASALDSLLDAGRLNRLANSEYRSQSTLTLPDLFARLQASVWSELSNGHVVTQTRRSLQTHHLSLLCQIATQKTKAPSDAVELANSELVRLQRSLETSLHRAKNPMQTAHFASCLALIRRTMNRGNGQ